MPRDDNAYLLDMLIAARDAVDFASALTYKEFERSRLHQDAIVKAIEIVGEAASRVSSQTQSAHPQIPWRQIVGLRNRLVHAYFEINLTTVWKTVHDDVPRLIAYLEPLFPPETP